MTQMVAVSVSATVKLEEKKALQIEHHKFLALVQAQASPILDTNKKIKTFVSLKLGS